MIHDPWNQACSELCYVAHDEWETFSVLATTLDCHSVARCSQYSAWRGGKTSVTFMAVKRSDRILWKRNSQCFTLIHSIIFKGTGVAIFDWPRLLFLYFVLVSRYHFFGSTSFEDGYLHTMMLRFECLSALTRLKRVKYRCTIHFFFLRDEGIFILANACSSTCTKTKNLISICIEFLAKLPKSRVGKWFTVSSPSFLKNFQLERTPAIAPTATAGHDEAWKALDSKQLIMRFGRDHVLASDFFLGAKL